ncbi:MAG: glycosyltransferase family 2 protein [Patescibacteria group bacterium]
MISVVILTKNEEKNIIDCLETVSWVDEIVIVDDNSADRTVEIVKNLENKKIKIFSRSLNEDFSAQRNFGLSKTTKKWVLFVDADERISSKLHEELNALIINNKEKAKDGYFINRKDYMWGNILKHGETGNISILRFAKRDSGVWIGRVHEVWDVEGSLGELESNLFHYPHQSIDEFLKEINFYSSIRANELYDKKVKVKMLDLITYPIGKFILNYVFKLGFLDKIDGLISSLMMSFHSFLVRSKLWLLWQKKHTS